jgi:ribulose-5-phosphate 4-epimerase/fuculose-1-phosphate aldolase
MNDRLRALLDDLVVASRVLAHEGVLDAFGHVSVRSPDDPEHYWLPRSRSPELVAYDDLLEYRLDGEPVVPTTQALFVERAIHGAIYLQRPDVHAICHNHSDAVIPFSVTGEALRPLVHVAALIGERVPVWDIADAFGDETDLLVRTIEHGRSLAATLGDGRTALMRGHGSVVAGVSLPDVVFTTIYLQRNAAMQMRASRYGPVRFLAPGEVARAAAVHRNPAIVGRAWEYWRARAGFSAPARAPA